MRSRRSLAWGLAALAVLALAGGAAAAPADHGGCFLSQPFAVLCSAWEQVLAPVQAVFGRSDIGSEIDPNGDAATTAPTAPTGEEETGSDPGDGSTELRPTIDPQG